MRFKTSLMLTVGCAGLLALSIPAVSLPSLRGAEPQPAQAHRIEQNKKAVPRASKAKGNPRAARVRHAARLVSMPVTEPPKRPLFGWPSLVSEARKYLGTNPTARTKLWCATFMNLVLAKAGYAGTNSDAAKSFAQYGRRISEPQIGAIAVLTRGKNGGHVGVVSGIDKNGNPVIISGNHNKRVGEATYSRARVIAYVMPSDDRPATTQVAERGSTNHSGSDWGLVSPITELLAAIEAEQSRPERPSQPAAQERPIDTRRVVQQPPAVPHRAVQQTAEQTPPSPQAGRRGLPLDPALAELFGVKDRVQAAPVKRPSQREQRVQQQSSALRLANAR
jgi:uncharacterized protein (TIGR02594 family)